jgi:hypothetical protein
MYARVNSRNNGPAGAEHVVKLDQVPRWKEQEGRPSDASDAGSQSSGSSSPDRSFVDPLTSISATENGSFEAQLSGASKNSKSKFVLDDEINEKIYLWRGQPWPLEVDAVVNSTNEVRLNDWHSERIYSRRPP